MKEKIIISELPRDEVFALGIAVGDDKTKKEFIIRKETIGHYIIRSVDDIDVVMISKNIYKVGFVSNDIKNIFNTIKIELKI